MPTNEELVAQAHDIELEGAESDAVATAVVDFVAAQKTAFDTAMADAAAKIAALTADALPAADRDAITASLGNAKTAFDNSQRVLTALVTPADVPIPEPVPTPEGARGKKR